MTLHEQRVEYLLQTIANELADVVFYAEKREGHWDSARSTREYYKREIGDMASSLAQEQRQDDEARRKSFLFRWFRRKFLV